MGECITMIILIFIYFLSKMKVEVHQLNVCLTIVYHLNGSFQTFLNTLFCFMIILYLIFKRKGFNKFIWTINDFFFNFSYFYHLICILFRCEELLKAVYERYGRKFCSFVSLNSANPTICTPDIWSSLVMINQKNLHAGLAVAKQNLYVTNDWKRVSSCIVYVIKIYFSFLVSRWNKFSITSRTICFYSLCFFCPFTFIPK